MKKGMKDVGGARKAERQRGDEAKRCHCLRSVAHPARQDLFGSLREEGRPEGPGSPLMPVFRDSKAASGTQPAALPCPPSCRFLGRQSLGAELRVKGSFFISSPSFRGARDAQSDHGDLSVLVTARLRKNW